MDKSAIQAIEANALIGTTVNTAETAIARPDNFVLHHLEHYRPQRDRFRGRMSTDSAGDFFSYCNLRADKLAKDTPAICFIDGQHMQAHTFFDIGDRAAPGHCEDRAMLELEKTAAFRKLLTVDEHRYDQRAMQDFLEDWRDHLHAIDAEGEFIDLRAAIAAISDIDIKATHEKNQSEGQFSSARSGFEKIEASSRHVLPYGFEFECYPYQPLDTRVFTLRLSLLTGHDKPLLSLRLMQREKHLEEITEEFKQLVADGLNSTTQVYIGAFDPRQP